MSRTDVLALAVLVGGAVGAAATGFRELALVLGGAAAGFVGAHRSSGKDAHP